MRKSLILLLAFVSTQIFCQNYYDLARGMFNENKIDSARFYINKSLQKSPTAEEYFLSAMIHEEENKQLRAIADYEAVIKTQPDNMEAYFQKGLIYYNTASTEQAIKDFTYVLENHSGSETKAIYFVNDPTGARGTRLTTLQSMISRVYQYRGMAYQKNGDWRRAIRDFNQSLEYDTTSDIYINRSQLFSKMGDDRAAIQDLKSAIAIEPDSYLAWYNLAILDPTTKLPSRLLEEDEFFPMLQLMGANAYEQGEYQASIQYYSSSIKSEPSDDLSYIGRGKAYIRMNSHSKARQDFIKAMQLNPSRSEAFYLIGNTLFHEKKFSDAVGFYERYLSVDQGYSNVWFNAAMAYLSLNKKDKGCDCLKNALDLGMSQADEMLKKHCDNP